MKICFKCNTSKELGDYYKHPNMADGYLNKCKECAKRDVQNNYANKRDYYHEYDKHRQRKDPKRIFAHRYTQIKQRIEGRAIRRYAVEGKELLSREEYMTWIEDNMDTFNTLYDRWIASGFKRGLTPSIDRIDNGRSYTLDNMRWISLSDNCTRGRK